MIMTSPLVGFKRIHGDRAPNVLENVSGFIHYGRCPEVWRTYRVFEVRMFEMPSQSLPKIAPIDPHVNPHQTTHFR